MLYYDLEKIRREFEKRALSAYQVSQEIPLSEQGILKILSGRAAKPRTSSLKALHDYLWPEGEKVEESSVKESLVREEKEAPRLEDLIALGVSDKVIEALRPFIEEFQDSHSAKSRKMEDVNKSLRGLAIAMGKLQKTVNNLESEIKEIKRMSKESNEVLTGR